METALSILDPYGRPIQASFENPSVSLNDPEAWFDLFGPERTDAGVRVTPERALGYPPLWRALNLISGDVGRMPLDTLRRQPNGGKERAKDHPSWKLLRKRASRVMRASAFKRTLTWHAMLYGNGTAFIQRDQLLRPRHLLVLDPSATGLLVVEDELFVTTTIRGQQVSIPYDDVFHVKGLSNNGIWGLSVLDLMRQALGLPIAAREYTSRFFGSGSNQSGVLMMPQHFNDEKIQNTIKMWNEMATGLAKAHKVALLHDNVKFVPTTVTPKDSETTPILEHEVRTISAITGAPPHKLGDVTRTSYNSLEQEEQAYLQDGLDPWLHEWEEEADTKLLSEEEQEQDVLFHEFNRNARLRMDSTARGNFYKVLRETGAFSANDILRRENMPTIGADGDIRFRPANWIPLGQYETPPNGAQMRLIEEILVKKHDIAQQKAVASANKKDSDDFVSWLDEFFADFRDVLQESLSAAREVVESQNSIDLRSNWDDTISRHVNDCQKVISEYVTENTAHKGPQNGNRALRLRIESTISPAGAHRLANKLLEHSHATRNSDL